MRTMTMLCTRTGVVSQVEVLPCTIEAHVAAINRLNRGASTYGIVYLPDYDCAEYRALLKID